MNDYLLFFRGGLDGRASPEQIQKAMQKREAWIDKLAKAGKLGFRGNRLSRTGSVIKGDKREVFEGLYVEGKEIVGGFTEVREVAAP